MITEQYVTFETAKLLKEAGFDSPTRGIYRTNRTGDHSFAEYNMKQTVDDLSWNAGDGFQYEYLAPTKSLAARWLREKHGIHIAVTPSNKAWYWELRTTDGAFMAGSAQHNPTFPTYEEALETGLREALEHIITQPKQHEYETRND